MRVRWTQLEVERLARSIVEFQAAYPVSDEVALENVQRKLLPEERWHRVPHLSAGLRHALERQRAKVLQAASPSTSDLEPLLEMLNLILDKLSQILARIPMQEGPAPQAPAWGPRSTKPRVVVAGLLPDQIRAVSNAVPEAEIETWNPRGSTAASPDFFVFVTGFMDHSSQDQIRASGARIINAGRGTGSVISAIRRTLSA